MIIFQQPFSSVPTTDVPLDTIKLRLRLSTEELEELFFGILGKDAQKAVNKYFHDINSFIDSLSESDIDIKIDEVADALTDIDYINNGNAAVFGIPIDATFAEVHRSNLSKLDEIGRPIFREDGKVMKGPKYSPPNLMPILEAYGYKSHE